MHAMLVANASASANANANKPSPSAQPNRPCNKTAVEAKSAQLTDWSLMMEALSFVLTAQRGKERKKSFKKGF